MTEQKLGPNQRKFVDKLRSGDIEQCTGSLQIGPRMCVLGVACLVAYENNVEVRTNDDDGELMGANLAKQDDVMEWYAFKDESGGFQYGYPDNDSLTALNDHQNKSFTEIADIIEANPSFYFIEEK